MVSTDKDSPLFTPLGQVWPLYPQSEQEPVAWRYRWSVEGGNWVWNYATYIERQKDDRCEPLYTTPPQRTWVGLTDEEVKDIVWNLPYEPSQEHIRAIEAKLKEKNT